MGLRFRWKRQHFSSTTIELYRLSVQTDLKLGELIIMMNLFVVLSVERNEGSIGATRRSVGLIMMLRGMWTGNVRTCLMAGMAGLFLCISKLYSVAISSLSTLIYIFLCIGVWKMNKINFVSEICYLYCNIFSIIFLILFLNSWSRLQCGDKEERATRRMYKRCTRSKTCTGCTKCVCFGCVTCRFEDCSCQSCVDFTRTMENRRNAENYQVSGSFPTS